MGHMEHMILFKQVVGVIQSMEVQAVLPVGDQVAVVPGDQVAVVPVDGQLAEEVTHQGVLRGSSYR